MNEVVESIKRFGYSEPIALNADNTILSGNVRYAALVAIYGKAKKVLCLRSPQQIPKAETQKAILRFNTHNGQWDPEKLKKFDKSILDRLHLSAPEYTPTVDPQTQDEKLSVSLGRMEQKEEERTVHVAVGELSVQVPRKLFMRVDSKLVRLCKYDNEQIQERLCKILKLAWQPKHANFSRNYQPNAQNVWTKRYRSDILQK